MANIASQKKRILRAERERLENRRHTSAVKTYFRRLEGAVAEGDAERVAAEHRTLVSLIDKASRPARCTATPAPARSPAPRASCAATTPPSSSDPACGVRGSVHAPIPNDWRALRTSSAAPGGLRGFLGEAHVPTPPLWVIAPIARSASVSSSSAEPPRRSSSRSASVASACCERARVGAADVGDERRRGLRRHPQLAADRARRLARARAAARRRAPRAAAASSSRRATRRARPGAQVQEDARRARRRRARRPRRRATRRGARRCGRRARRPPSASRRAPGPHSSASFSSSRASRARRVPTIATSVRAAAASSVRPSSAACAIAHFGRSHSLTAISALMSPPASRTARCSDGGALARPSSRAKNAIVVSAGIAASAGARCSATSASFQRSTPSTITKRRPIASVSVRSSERGVERRRALEHLERRRRRPTPRRARAGARAARRCVRGRRRGSGTRA